jgi:acyl-CoA synthetase (AMP-forming)/AMP-acid ligase II
MVVELSSNYFIEKIFTEHHDKCLLYDVKGKPISAGELYSNSLQLALACKQNEVSHGDKVVLLVKPGIDFLITIYANMMMGTTIAILDPEMGPQNYQAKFSQFDPHHIFVESGLVFLNEHPILKYIIRKLINLPYYPKSKGKKIFTSGPKLPISSKHLSIRSLLKCKQPLNVELNSIDVNMPFLVTYTSGTIHEPKGVLHTYNSLGNSISILSNRLKLQDNNIRMATHLPHYMLIGISANVTVHLWDNMWSSSRKIKFITKNNITTLFGPPSDFVALIAHCTVNNRSFPDCIANIYLGSAPIYPSFLERLHAVAPHIIVTCLYGMTESLLCTNIDSREKIAFKGKGDIVGKPFDGVRLKIDESNEIWIASSQMYSHYWGANDKVEWHATGDLGMILADGNLVLIGRKKDMIIRRNFNIYPSLYEPTINSIEGVNESALIGIYNEELADQEVILVVENFEGHQFTEKQILQKLSQGPNSIDKEAIPDKIIFMKLPRSGRQNKVNKNVLVQNISSTRS